MENIILSGPSGVGKSLIAQQLSQKTDIPSVSIDDLLVFAEYEKDGIIANNPAAIRQFKRACLQSCYDDERISDQTYDETLLKKQKDIINEYADEYIKYTKLFGNLSAFYSIVDNYYTYTEHMRDCSMKTRLAFQQFFQLQMMMTVFKRTRKKPIILDTSAIQGWKLPKFKPTEADLRFFKRFGINFDFNAQREYSAGAFEENGINILILPGQDYAERSASTNSPENELLLANLKLFHNYADLCVSVNGMFTETDSPAFDSRLWFDARSTIQREELMNKGELANICDMILMELQDINTHINQSENN